MGISIIPKVKVLIFFAVLSCAFNGYSADSMVSLWLVTFSDQSDDSSGQKKTQEVPPAPPKEQISHANVMVNPTPPVAPPVAQLKNIAASAATSNVTPKDKAFFIPAVAEDIVRETPKRQQAVAVQAAPLSSPQYIAPPEIKPSIVNDKPVSVTKKSGLVSLREAITSSVKWHPLIKRAESELAQSKEYINEVKSSYYPSLNARVRSGFEENAYTGKEDLSHALVLSANQVLYDFGKTQSKVKLANSSASRQVSGLDKNINDIGYETANSYLQSIRYSRLTEIAQKQVDGFSIINEISRKRASLGASAQSDYSQSKVRLASSVALQRDNEAQAKRWASVLDNITNDDISSRLRTDFPKEIGNQCLNISASELTSPTIAMAHAQIEMAKDQIASSKAEYFPTISLNPSYEYQLDDDNNNNSTKKGRWGVFVNVSVPLFEGGAQVSKTRQSEQALHAARYNFDQEQTEARRRIGESAAQITTMQESLEAKLTREKEALQTRDLYKLQYVELGTRSFSDLLSAESEIHQTRMDIVNSQYMMSTLAVDCLYYSGRLAEYFAPTEKEKI